MLRYFYLIIVVCVGLCGIVFGVSEDASSGKLIQEELSLDLVHSLVKSYNPNIKAYSIGIDSSKAKGIQASVLPNPEIGLEVENFGGSEDNSGFKSAETTISISQEISISGKIKNRKLLAKEQVKIASRDHQIKIIEVLSLASQTFYKNLILQNKVEILDELVNVFEESGISVKSRVDAGKSSPLEVSRSAVALSVAKLKLSEANSNLELARKELSFYWGNYQVEYNKVIGDIEDFRELDNLEDYEKQLLISPYIQRWDDYILHAKTLKSLVNSESKPNPSVMAGYRRLEDVGDDVFVFGFSMPLPVNNSNRGNKLEASYNLSMAYEQKNAAVLDSIKELNSLYSNLSNLYHTVVNFKEEILPASIQLYESSKKAYAQGKIDYLNHLDSLRTLFETKLEYIELLGKYHSSRIALECMLNENEIKIYQEHSE